MRVVEEMEEEKMRRMEKEMGWENLFKEELKVKVRSYMQLKSFGTGLMGKR